MEISAASIEVYLAQAFAGMHRVLDRLDDDTVNERPPAWGTNSVAGLVTHCCELAPWWFAAPGLGRDAPRDRDAEFVTTATVAELHRTVDAAAERTSALVHEFEAGPTATDHEIRAFMPGEDGSDGAVVLHVLEELFQHLGHMEVTADALGR